MNPCPCGHHTGRRERCTCSPATVRRYAGRVSGPLLDRIDLHVDVPAVRWRELRDRRPGEPSARVRSRVVEARERAARRFRDLRGPSSAAGNGGPPAGRAGPSGPPGPAGTPSPARVNAALGPRELEHG